MNQKRLNLFLILGIMLFVSISFVSASWFSDFFGKAKITGQTTGGYLCNSGQQIGDVDGNNLTQAVDASIVLQIASGLIDYPSDICCADADQNGIIQAADSSLIQQIAAGTASSPGICGGSGGGGGTTTCTDSDGTVETKEINEKDAKTVAGLYIAVEEADETNLKLSADLDISYLNEHFTDIDLTSDNPSETVLIDGIDYIITLVSASDTAATIEVDNERNYYTKGTITGTGIGEKFEWTDQCYTDADEFNLIEMGCTENGFEQRYYECPNGCVDGACVREINKTTCTDSDGGKNYYKKGVLTPYNKTDSCVTNFDNTNIEMGDLEEYYCTGNEYDPWTLTRYYCPLGCVDGACVKTQYSGTCSDLVDFVANPSDFEDEYGIKFDLSQNYIQENDEESIYSAEWISNYYEDYYYMFYNIQVFNNKSFDASSLIENLEKYEMCVEKEINGNTVYVCNYNPLEDGYKRRVVMWAKENVLISISTMYSDKEIITEEQKDLAEIKNIENFINQLKSNDYTYEYSNFELNYHFSSIISEQLEICPSNLESGKLPYSYGCKVEPVICPEHGYQTQICIAWDPVKNEEITKEQQIDCSPGICSGCYVPKWFDYKGNNKCIPYGFRFESQIGWRDEEQTQKGQSEISIEEVMKQQHDINLTITSDGKATLMVEGWKKSYTFKQGDTVVVDVTGWQEDIIYLSFVATKVVYDAQDYEKSYIVLDLTVTYLGKSADTINAYCDIDGYVKPQKTKEAGEWAKCQNNYECDSNLCSSGECIELKDIAGEASALKKLAVKVFCRVLSIFGEDYDQCLIDNGI